ncbi:glycosyltransferase family 39 protein [Sphaerospermopsis sp. LEGE 00249]|uniref:ArnT family glycosyltransferase n=1 Tax=Sphaerospermopsis sp. LEGE 00249 TaxID=1380707 RepID=UPI00164E1B76|nr:glycosyltransferase family 39 protein [Sphaerospermopsis sp. LEGE 00249]MBC5796619.1 glycosyltransferase family 39 protein [Sphaerospermopsis sp. LEGE 00249]
MVQLRLSSVIHKHPQFILLLLSALLLFANNGNNSLLAYDEAYYAIQARWMLETQDWLTPQWWGTPIYDRTVGIQWLIALTYQIFGINEFSARLPSIISCIISVILTYQIGTIILNRQVAFLAAIILCLMPIWIFEGRSATQNTPLVCVELLGIWALLRGEELGNKQQKQKILWGILAGATFGLGFLIKGFMIILPGVAIIPYLIFRNKQHRYLENIGIYLGLIIGFIPVIIWLTLSCLKYNSFFPVTDLFGKLLYLSADDTYNPGTFYYFWNIPLNTFPWALFSVIGIVCILFYRNNHISLLLGYPIILFILLCSFRTRTPYYPLQILPFMALFASVALIRIEDIYQLRKKRVNQIISYLLSAFTTLGILLLVLGSLITLNIHLPVISLTPEIQQYGILGIILGASWATINTTWKNRKFLPNKYWLASWVISPYLTITTLGFISVLGDRNPVFRTELQQPQIHQILAVEPINFVIDNPVNNKSDAEVVNYSEVEISKTFMLLSFYTPQLGKITKIQDLQTNSYAWITPKIPTNTLNQYEIMGTVKGWKLIYKN